MNNFMQIRDIWSLLDQYKADGFSLKCLSKITDTSNDVIERCYNREELNQDDVKELNTVLWFLGQLYAVILIISYIYMRLFRHYVIALRYLELPLPTSPPGTIGAELLHIHSH